MNNRFYGTNELKDKEIVEALRQAAADYENGEIIEVSDILCEIVKAIDLFMKEVENDLLREQEERTEAWHRRAEAKE